MRSAVPSVAVLVRRSLDRVGRLPAFGVLPLASAFVAASFFLRLAFTNNLQADDAELVLEADALRGGYSEQPPLYTWMLWAVFQLTGPGVVGHGIVRGALLLALVRLTYLTARLVVPDRRFHLPLAFSALLMPAYGWHVATYLTHSLLLGVAVMGTAYAVVRVIRSGRTLDYALLGVMVGVGALAKYNFPLVVLAAAVAGLTVPAVRSRILSVRLLVTAAVALFVLLPHLIWLADHWEDVYRLVRNKSNGAAAPAYWVGVWQGVVAGAVALALSVALLAPLLAWLGRGTPRSDPTDPALAWLGRFLVALFAVHLALVFGFGVTKFQDRWLQPLLLPLPLWYLGRFAPGTVGGGRVRLLSGMTAMLAVGVLAGQTVQVALVDRLSARFELRLDYPRFAEELQAAGFGECVFISWDREIVGNLRPYMPAVRMWYTTGVRKYDEPATAVAVLWDERWGKTPPWALTPELNARFGQMRMVPARLRTFTLHPQHADGRPATVYVYRMQKHQIQGESPR